MNTLRPVRLRQAWQHWPKGHVFTAMPAAQAQYMVAAGQAEYADDEQKVIEAAAAATYRDESIPAAPADRMMRSGKRRGQGGGRFL